VAGHPGDPPGRGAAACSALAPWWSCPRRFTHVVRFLDEDIDPDAEETRDERFEFGLDCVLDGIAVKIAQISRRPSA
jgi:hypothetical protein